MTALLAKDLLVQKNFIIAGFVIVWLLFVLSGAFEGLSLTIPAAIYSHFLIMAASKTDKKTEAASRWLGCSTPPLASKLVWPS